MVIVCAPDSFKESMTAAEAAAAMERGIRRVLPEAEVRLVPLADGGEGTLEALRVALGAEPVSIGCHDALGREIDARYLRVSARRLAVVEMAEASGLERLTPGERDPLVASSWGVGELIRAALDWGAERLLVGLGGSATNDAGAGMLAALGMRFLDEDGRDLPPGGVALARLARIDADGFDRRLGQAEIVIASDVTNPLLGPRGASRVFGPQKGAGPGDVARLDAALTRWADVVERATNRRVRDEPGSGAAGGLAAALLAFTPASIRSGADIVMEQVGFDALVEEASLVLTGEGRWDAQSASGKVPAAVAARARAAGTPTLVFAGSVAWQSPGLPRGDAAAVVPIVGGPCSLEEALTSGPENLERAVAMALELRSLGARSR